MAEAGEYRIQLSEVALFKIDFDVYTSLGCRNRALTDRIQALNRPGRLHRTIRTIHSG